MGLKEIYEDADPSRDPTNVYKENSLRKAILFMR